MQLLLHDLKIGCSVLSNDFCSVLSRVFTRINQSLNLCLIYNASLTIFQVLNSSTRLLFNFDLIFGVNCLNKQILK